MVIVEVNDYAQGLAIIKAVLDEGASSQAGDPALDPGIARHPLGAGYCEVLHDPERFGVGSEIRMKEPMRAGVFVSVAERDLVAEGVLRTFIRQLRKKLEDDPALCGSTHR
jgi:hypothetical protein